MKIYTIKTLILLVLIHANTSMAACIGVVTFSASASHFWAEVNKGAIAAGKELDIPLYIRGPIDENNVQGQKAIIKAAIAHGCKGFVIAPSSIEINEVTLDLAKKNIPSVYIDRDYGGNRLSIISTNNYAAGVAAGREMLKALKGKSRVALMRTAEETISTGHREQGFVDIITRGGAKIVIDEYVGARNGDARKKAFEILKGMHDIDGIFTPSETATLGVLLNRQQLMYKKNIIHIGFDTHEKMIDALGTGYLYGFIIQNPFQMGYQGVQNIYEAMMGVEIMDEIDTEIIFVNQENIGSSAIKRALNIKLGL
jgi:ribose transport system substrate-binding protein